jgi:hypothetical protein
MFVQITDWHNNPVSIDPARVIKIREAGIADEPMDTVFIDYVSGGTFAKDSLKNIVKLFGTYIRLAALHAPNGMPVFLNSDGVASIDVDDRYDGNSVAIVSRDFENMRVPARNKIALEENAADATRIIESAALQTTARSRSRSARLARRPRR